MYINTSIDKTILKERAKLAVADLEEKIQTGQINSEQDLLLAISSAWASLYTGNEESTIVIPPYRTGELPMKDDLESPLYSAEDDINNLWFQYNAIREILLDNFNSEKSEFDLISTLIGNAQNKTTKFQLFSTDNSNLFLWASDSFTSLSNIDQTKTTAYIDTNIGIATLRPTKLDSLIQYITSFSIDTKNSIGVPGNNLEIQQENGPTSPDAQSQEPQATLVGSTDLRSSASYIFDNNPSTWFEWEYNYIPEIQKCQSIQTAWHKSPSGKKIDVRDVTKDNTGTIVGWRKFIQWPGSTNIDRGDIGTGYPMAYFDKIQNAKLIMNLQFDQPRTISTIQITPQALGGIVPIVKDITIFSGKNSLSIAKNVYLTQKLNEALSPSTLGIPEGNYSGVGVWSIKNGPIDKISITLEANGSYQPKNGFGHHYYFRILNKRTETTYLGLFHDVSNNTWTERLPNPPQAISTGLSGGSLSQIGEVIGLAAAGPIGALIGGIVGGLFSQSSETDIVRQGDAYDIFDGQRSAIGIKDIDISIKEYDLQNVIVSEAHYFPQTIKAVTVISTETIPDNWDHNTEWISYEVSSDKQAWVSIVPQNRSKGINDIVYMNTNNVFVRITLRRPTSAINETCELDNYALKCS